MRELTPVEMQNFSGAVFFDFFGAIVIGGVTCTTAFGLKWAMSGDRVGGIVCSGSISGDVSLIVGAHADEFSKPGR